MLNLCASWGKQALSNSFQHKYFKLLVSLNFWILLWCLVNAPQALNVNRGYFKCKCGRGKGVYTPFSWNISRFASYRKGDNRDYHSVDPVGSL